MPVLPESRYPRLACYLIKRHSFHSMPSRPLTTPIPNLYMSHHNSDLCHHRYKRKKNTTPKINSNNNLLLIIDHLLVNNIWNKFLNINLQQSVSPSSNKSPLIPQHTPITSVYFRINPRITSLLLLPLSPIKQINP